MNGKQGRMAWIFTILGLVLGFTPIYIMSYKVGLILTAVVIIIVGPVVLWSILPQIMDERILSNGVSAKAVVLDVIDTGWTFQNDPKIKLILEVHPKKGEPYQVKKGIVIPRLNPYLFTPGMELDVKIDPGHRKRIAIDM